MLTVEIVNSTVKAQTSLLAWLKSSIRPWKEFSRLCGLSLNIPPINTTPVHFPSLCFFVFPCTSSGSPDTSFYKLFGAQWWWEGVRSQPWQLPKDLSIFYTAVVSFYKCPLITIINESKIDFGEKVSDLVVFLTYQVSKDVPMWWFRHAGDRLMVPSKPLLAPSEHLFHWHKLSQTCHKAF